MSFPAFYPNAGQMQMPIQQQPMPNQWQGGYQQPSPVYAQPIQPPPQMNMQPPALTGKFVESKDIVNVSEIPMGSYGIFPRTDLKEIYIKVWNKEGSTDTITYLPVENPLKNQTSQNDEVTLAYIDQILQKINNLEQKIDSLGTVKKQEVVNVIEEPQPQQSINNF